MRLVLYSGGDFKDNAELDKELVRLVAKKNPSVAYIPSTCGFGEQDFREFVTHFRRYKFSEFSYFPVDRPFTDAAAHEVLRRDIIFLSGGNTFHFLHHFKKTIIFSKMKDFLKRGGVLAGLSAGAIMMTPSIHTASFPSFDCDKNAEGIKNLNSLNLVPFEFFPHFKNSKRYSKEILEYSKKNKYPVLGCPDGAGIVIDQEKKILIGECTLFLAGEKVKV